MPIPRKSNTRARVRRKAVLAAVALCFLITSGGFTADVTKYADANYILGARFTPAKIRKMVFDTTVNPRWMEHSDRFWYSYQTPAGRFYYIVDPAKKTKILLFDNVKMAADLTRLSLDPYDHQNLPIRNLKFIKEDRAIQFELDSSQDEESAGGQRAAQGEGQRQAAGKKKILYFEYDIAAATLTLLMDYKEPFKRPEWASFSPDKKHVVFSRDNDLYMMDEENYRKFEEKEKARLEQEKIKPPPREQAEKQQSDVDPDIAEHRLTSDGEEHYSYGRIPRGQTDEQKTKNKGKRQPVNIVWSKDSGRFALVRSDSRKVADLWVVNAVAQPRPTLETYKYDMPGEKNVTQYEIHVFDVAAKSQTKIKVDKFKDQSVSILQARPNPRPSSDDAPRPALWLSDSAQQLYFSRMGRDMKKLDIGVADTVTGEVKILIEERLNTYIETQRLELINGGKELVHWSERDGWGHYYLYDSEGNLKNQITSGPFSCREVEGIDEKNKILYFSANGREPAVDPYYTFLYQVKLDGTGVKLLSPGDSNHAISMHDSTRYFIDNHSRMDIVPKSVLHDNSGERILDLETADLSLLTAAGYRFPELFTVKADDGVTDLYGVMFKPFDFDETRKYPVITYVYPGPQTEGVPKAFTTDVNNSGLAQFGFVVVAVGNRGGHPARSKWYHNYGYGNLRDYGLADKKAAIEQLAARHPFIDIDRVGIFGHSGGGFMTTAAMLVYPDFFRVGIASAGNHENNIYNKTWSEKHHGIKEVTDKEGNISFEYNIEKNTELAKNLKGRLLLVTGDIDNNVHPANTLRMVDALIKANKRFDFFMFPGQRHGFGDMSDYWFWLKADYFCKHLLGDYRSDVEKVELSRDIEQTGNKRRR